MFIKTFECPSCGANIDRQNPGSKSISCHYCGQTSHITDKSLDAVGKKNPLIDYGSYLKVGKRGKYNNQRFTILGRVRMEYDDGFWDEWYINFDRDNKDGVEGWIQEDDGAFMIFRQENKSFDHITFDNIKVGQIFHLSEFPIFITSKSRAHIVGGEGELPFQIIPREDASFVEGIWEGKIVSIELHPSEQIVFIGDKVSLFKLELI